MSKEEKQQPNPFSMNAMFGSVIPSKRYRHKSFSISTVREGRIQHFSEITRDLLILACTKTTSTNFPVLKFVNLSAFSSSLEELVVVLSWLPPDIHET
jgi:hypothetical protein